MNLIFQKVKVVQTIVFTEQTEANFDSEHIK